MEKHVNVYIILGILNAINVASIYRLRGLKSNQRTLTVLSDLVTCYQVYTLPMDL